jgi:hypothetical protein
MTLLLAAFAAAAGPPAAADLSGWTPQPAALKPADAGPGRAVLSSDPWAFLLAPAAPADAELAATVTIRKKAQAFGYFGEHWSVWPDPTYPDQGFEAGVVVRRGEATGYRVQLSHALQEVALVKYPDGGYVRSVPCPVKLGTPIKLSVAARGAEVAVTVDGVERVRFRDDFLPLAGGTVGVGVSSRAEVAFADVAVRPLPPAPAAAPPGEHTPKFSARKWVGGRTWVFDGDEPVMLLDTAGYINNVKLRPGYKPQLSWNPFWDTSNQGAYKEGAVKPTAPTTAGGGATLTAAWTAMAETGRFEQRMKLAVGYDPDRGTYTYDTDTALEVKAGPPVHFRFGLDFEHHTPLDPFNWQYLLVRDSGGTVTRRPVSPQDPGTLRGLSMTPGARVWYGRHNEPLRVAPAVEYDLSAEVGRVCDTAVCAAFYDTGIGYRQDTVPAGKTVRAQFRYTGYPAAEAERLFRDSRPWDNPRLDPARHYVFADTWPKVTFADAVPLSEPWTPGRRPFLSGHNARPTYEWVAVPGGHALKLGPVSAGTADLAVPHPLPPGRYAVLVRVKSDNAVGPGGRVGVKLTDKAGKVLAGAAHHVGNGTFDWKSSGFVVDVPAGTAGVAVTLANPGTGDVLVTDLEVRRVEAGAGLPAGVAAKPAPPPAAEPVPAGAYADFRLREGKGRFVHNHAGRAVGPLELANLDWVTDGGRPALRFADGPPGRADFTPDRYLGTRFFSPAGGGYDSYKSKTGLPFAVAGTGDGDGAVPGRAVTLVAHVKPAARMGAGEHPGEAHVIGLGRRMLILRLVGEKAPYGLTAAADVNDRLTADVELAADRWYQVAVTAEPAGAKWRMRLYVDGEQVKEGVTSKFDAPAALPDVLVFGAEEYYLHSNYYRGLLGRTLAFTRALTGAELKALAAQK